MAFTVVQASGKQRVTPLQHASPKRAAHSPTPTGNSFGALDVTDADDASDEKAADSDDTLYKAVVATSPEVGHILRRQDQKLDATFTTLMDTLFKKMDDRFAKMDDRFAELTLSMDKREQRHVDLMSQMEDRLLTTIETFNGKLGDLRQDVNDHERQLSYLKSSAHDKRLSALNSDLLTQDSLLKGYKATSETIVATLCSDVNDTWARIPELRREIQDSVASLKTIEALVLRQQEQGPSRRDVIRYHTYSGRLSRPSTYSQSEPFQSGWKLDSYFSRNGFFPIGNSSSR